MSEPFDAAGFNEDVGRRLQFARKQKGMTQQDAADAVGIKRTTYANVETGRQRIPVDLLWRLAIVYGKRLDLLTPEPRQ